MTDTRLREDRWRVRRYVVPVPKQAAVARPWQLQSPVPAPPPTTQVAVWGVWPPQWLITHTPMLMFPVWHMAFRAAWDRAQFAAVPPISQAMNDFLPQLESGEFPHG